MDFLTPQQLSETSLPDVGNKAFNLWKLHAISTFNVPHFVVLPTHIFESWQKNNRVSDDVVSQLADYFRSRNVRHVAVRSSTNVEDSQGASYAGLFNTRLFVALDQLKDSILDCYQAVQSKGLSQYKKTQTNSEIKIALVIQEMVESDASGVVFSRSPVGNSAVILMESTFGLGESLVSGHAEVDQFRIDRFGELISQDIATKYQKLSFDHAENKLTYQAIPSSLQQESSINQVHLDALFSATLDIESLFNVPVDIEWAVGSDTLYILQARPITKPFATLKYYTDTNLSESYPGLCSRFTCDIVKTGYRKTYNEACIWMTSSSYQKMDDICSQLIADFGGHLYYDIDQFYRLLYLMPGGKKNIDNWHDMIGNNIKTPFSADDSAKLTTWDTIRYGLYVLKIFLFHRSIFTKTFRNSEKYLATIISETYACNSSRDAIKSFRAGYNGHSGFGLTAINDFKIMMCIGLLKSFLKKNNLDPEQYSQLLGVNEVLDSLKPLVQIQDILRNIEDYPAFISCFNDGIQKTEHVSPFQRTTDILAHLDNNGYSNVAKQLDHFLQEFGDRGFEELKIETEMYNQSPQKLVQLFDLVRRSNPRSQLKDTAKKSSLDLSGISFFQRQCIKLITKITKQAVATRESGRLLRSKYFGWIRTSSLSIFHLLRNEYPDLFGSFTDQELYGVTLTELYRYADMTLTVDELSQIAETHRSWATTQWDYPQYYAHPENDTCAPYFTTKNAVQNISYSENVILGTAASTGEIYGEPIIIQSPHDPILSENLSNKILVTQSTDPAWVYLMSQTAGLISEKGSVLSHTAIIGRELGIPAVVGVKHATHLLKHKKRIRLCGTSGTIEIIE